MSAALLELIDVAKCFRSNWTFRSIAAIDGLSISIDPGEVYGLIGHNGAGKTTTLKIIVGLLRPTRGRMRFNGTDLDWRTPRRGIGFSPEQAYFHDYLTVAETLHFYGQLYGLESAHRRARVAAVVAQLGLGHKLRGRMRTLSKGTMQRVAVAQAILHEPPLVILDEPMSGLDPAGRKDMRDLILALKRRGTAVLFSSHILSDAEALCDRVAILSGGTLREVVNLTHDTTEPRAFSLTIANAHGRILELLAQLAASPPVGDPQRCTVTLADRASVSQVLRALQGTDAYVEALVPERPTLEQRFLRYTGNGSHVD